MKFGLQRVSIWVNIQKKFQVPRSHSIGENCAFCSKPVWPRNMKFGLHRVSIWVYIQKKFQVPRSHSIGEKCFANFLQDIIAFFSQSVRPRNMKFGLQRVSIWVNIQNKFQVPRSYCIGEKCDANFKLSLHFSPKVCDRETWNLVCKEYPCRLIYKKNFKFLSRTVSEKNAMLTCNILKLFIRTIVQLWIFASNHRIFLENCATEEHEIWFAKSIHKG